ncbi:hypothetical protein [Zavarzinia sp. CC-PAN008]|uniref:hypothetical protein n=1 Tax=Zavarzinia sp. CC-PAN008 TaxID=3243332 RepID=UPI003F745FE7
MVSPSKAVVAAIESIGPRNAARPKPAAAALPAAAPPRVDPGYALPKAGPLGRVIDILV